MIGINIFKYSNKTDLINAIIKSIVEDISLDLNNGNIKTKTEYVYRIKHAVDMFYKNINKPMYKFKEFYGVPIKEDIEYIVNSILRDISLMSDDCSVLSSIVDSILTESTYLNSITNKKIKSVSGSIKSLLDSTSTQTNNGKYNIYESFYNYDFSSGTASTTGEINTKIGAFSLSSIYTKNITKQCNIEVLPGSNGFPGNSHEVSLNNENITFIGENDLHNRLSSIIDNNLDTWFEYEMYNVKDENDILGYNGFKYKENISWISEDNVLKLNLRITLDTPEILNSIEIYPFIKSINGTPSFKVSKVIISNGDVIIQTVYCNDDVNDNTIVEFNSQEVKFIDFFFEQKSYYETTCGRNIYNKEDMTNNNYFSKDLNDVYKYSNDSFISPTVEDLGVIYDPISKSIIVPNSKQENYNYYDFEKTKNKLFYNSNINSTIKSIAAYRYIIGIKDIALKSKAYTNNGDYVSKVFSYDNPIKLITLYAKDYIPQYFYKYGNVNDFIKYFVSFDNGNKWIRVYPFEKAHLGQCSIAVNSSTIVSARNENINYVDLINDPTSFIFKISLSKPDEVTYDSPIVKNYKLIVSDKDVE